MRPLAVALLAALPAWASASAMVGAGYGNHYIAPGTIKFAHGSEGSAKGSESGRSSSASSKSSESGSGKPAACNEGKYAWKTLPGKPRLACTNGVCICGLPDERYAKERIEGGRCVCKGSGGIDWTATMMKGGLKKAKDGSMAGTVYPQLTDKAKKELQKNKPKNSGPFGKR